MVSRASFMRAAALLLCGVAAQALAGTVELPVQVGGAFSVPVVSLREARLAATVRQQYDFSCGSAALATLLTHHFATPTSEQAVFDAMIERGDREQIRRLGFSLLDMKRYLESRGFQADGFEAPLSALVEATTPAVVLINERGYNHFVVVKGLRDGRVLFGDPAGGTRAMNAAAFEALRVNDILFVISERVGRFNDAGDWRVAPRAPLSPGRVNVEPGVPALPHLGRADF